MHLSNQGRTVCPTLPIAIATTHTKGYDQEHDEGNRDGEHRGAITAFHSDGNTHQNLGIVVDQFHDAISKILRDEDGHRVLN